MYTSLTIDDCKDTKKWGNYKEKGRKNLEKTSCSHIVTVVTVTYFSFPFSFSMSIFFILFNTRNITFNNYHKPQITYHILLKIEMLKSN